MKPIYNYIVNLHRIFRSLLVGASFYGVFTLGWVISKTFFGQFLIPSLLGVGNAMAAKLLPSVLAPWAGGVLLAVPLSFVVGGHFLVTYYARDHLKFDFSKLFDPYFLHIALGWVIPGALYMFGVTSLFTASIVVCVTGGLTADAEVVTNGVNYLMERLMGNPAPAVVPPPADDASVPTTVPLPAQVLAPTRVPAPNIVDPAPAADNRIRI